MMNERIKHCQHNIGRHKIWQTAPIMHVILLGTRPARRRRGRAFSVIHHHGAPLISVVSKKDFF